jgi:hypothetical protein
VGGPGGFGVDAVFPGVAANQVDGEGGQAVAKMGPLRDLRNLAGRGRFCRLTEADTTPLVLSLHEEDILTS